VADSRTRSTCNGDSTYCAFPADHSTAGYPVYPVAGTRGGRIDACAMARWDRMVEECGIRGEVP
jgi:hypothetical protein